MMVEHYTGMGIEPDLYMDVIGRGDRYTNGNQLIWLLELSGLEVERGFEEPRIVLLNGNHWVVYLGDGFYHDPLEGPYQRGYLGREGIYITGIREYNLTR